jgi:hypothetical protein
MVKIIPTIFLATAWLLISNHQSTLTLAGTCASDCGPRPIEFKPGQFIRVKVVNRTPRLLKLQKITATGTISLQPKQEITLEHGYGTTPNISLIFWDDTGLSLKAKISKPNFGTLYVELLPNWDFPGHRSVYILNNGRVEVF